MAYINSRDSIMPFKSKHAELLWSALLETFTDLVKYPCPFEAKVIGLISACSSSLSFDLFKESIYFNDLRLTMATAESSDQKVGAGSDAEESEKEKEKELQQALITLHAFFVDTDKKEELFNFLYPGRTIPKKELAAIVPATKTASIEAVRFRVMELCHTEAKNSKESIEVILQKLITLMNSAGFSSLISIIPSIPLSEEQRQALIDSYTQDESFIRLLSFQGVGSWHEWAHLTEDNKALVTAGNKPFLRNIERYQLPLEMALRSNKKTRQWIDDNLKAWKQLTERSQTSLSTDTCEQFFQLPENIKKFLVHPAEKYQLTGTPLSQEELETIKKREAVLQTLYSTSSTPRSLAEYLSLTDDDFSQLCDSLSEIMAYENKIGLLRDAAIAFATQREESPSEIEIIRDSMPPLAFILHWNEVDKEWFSINYDSLQEIAIKIKQPMAEWITSLNTEKSRRSFSEYGEECLTDFFHSNSPTQPLALHIFFNQPQAAQRLLIGQTTAESYMSWSDETKQWLTSHTDTLDPIYSETHCFAGSLDTLCSLPEKNRAWLISNHNNLSKFFVRKPPRGYGYRSNYQHTLTRALFSEEHNDETLQWLLKNHASLTSYLEDDSINESQYEALNLFIRSDRRVWLEDDHFLLASYLDSECSLNQYLADTSESSEEERSWIQTKRENIIAFLAKQNVSESDLDRNQNIGKLCQFSTKFRERIMQLSPDVFPPGSLAKMRKIDDQTKQILSENSDLICAVCNLKELESFSFNDFIFLNATQLKTLLDKHDQIPTLRKKISNNNLNKNYIRGMAFSSKPYDLPLYAWILANNASGWFIDHYEQLLDLAQALPKKDADYGTNWEKLLEPLNHDGKRRWVIEHIDSLQTIYRTLFCTTEKGPLNFLSFIGLGYDTGSVINTPYFKLSFCDLMLLPQEERTATLTAARKLTTLSDLGYQWCDLYQLPSTAITLFEKHEKTIIDTLTFLKNIREVGLLGMPISISKETQIKHLTATLQLGDETLSWLNAHLDEIKTKAQNSFLKTQVSDKLFSFLALPKKIRDFSLAFLNIFSLDEHFFTDERKEALYVISELYDHLSNYEKSTVKLTLDLYIIDSPRKVLSLVANPKEEEEKSDHEQYYQKALRLIAKKMLPKSFHLNQLIDLSNNDLKWVTDHEKNIAAFLTHPVVSHPFGQKKLDSLIAMSLPLRNLLIHDLPTRNPKSEQIRNSNFSLLDEEKSEYLAEKAAELASFNFPKGTSLNDVLHILKRKGINTLDSILHHHKAMLPLFTNTETGLLKLNPWQSFFKNSLLEPEHYSQLVSRINALISAGFNTPDFIQNHLNNFIKAPPKDLNLWLHPGSKYTPTDWTGYCRPSFSEEETQDIIAAYDKGLTIPLMKISLLGPKSRQLLLNKHIAWKAALGDSQDFPLKGFLSTMTSLDELERDIDHYIHLIQTSSIPKENDNSLPDDFAIPDVSNQKKKGNLDPTSEAGGLVIPSKTPEKKQASTSFREREEREEREEKEEKEGREYIEDQKKEHRTLSRYSVAFAVGGTALSLGISWILPTYILSGNLLSTMPAAFITPGVIIGVLCLTMAVMTTFAAVHAHQCAREFSLKRARFKAIAATRSHKEIENHRLHVA